MNLSKHGVVVGDRKVDCLRFWSHHDSPIDRIKDGVIFAGLKKLHFYGNDREQLRDLGDRTTMVVFDEAHQVVATTYQDIVETIATRNERVPVLGLSATPGRTWERPEIDATVAERFYDNKVTIDFGGSDPIERLVEDGYLSEVKFSQLNVEAGIELSANDIEEVSHKLKIPDSLVIRLGNDEQRNLRIVQKLIELSKNHRRIIVFAASVENAILLERVCKGIGLEADAVTGNTNINERKNKIKRFKREGATPRVLINYGVLTTGFDAPAASATIIARPTKSLVLYSQMVGRVIRGPKSGGTEKCEVVSVVDTNLPGFGNVADAFSNWEDVWNVNQ